MRPSLCCSSRAASTGASGPLKCWSRQSGTIERCDQKQEAMAMRLHHIGIAVREIAPAMDEYVSLLGYEVLSGVIRDPIQTAFVQFLKMPCESVCLELVAPDGEGSKLVGALKRGG